MGAWQGKGMIHYSNCLNVARRDGTIGVNKHMMRPTPPNSRLGYKARPVKQTDLRIIAEKLVEAAKKNPLLAAAAANAQSHIKKKTTCTKPKTNEIKVIAGGGYNDSNLSQTQSTQRLSVPVQMPLVSEAELREKIRQQNLKKLADDLKSDDFSGWSKLKLSNNPG